MLTNKIEHFMQQRNYIKIRQTKTNENIRWSIFMVVCHIQSKQIVLPRSLKLRGIFKRTNDHIFEKTMNQSCLPCPRPTPLNGDG